MHEAWARRPRALAHADQLAQALDLDMAATGWEPTVDGYLGRVTKARILEAVREGCGDVAAERLTPLKKGDMAEQAQMWLAGRYWLPTPLRTPGRPLVEAAPEPGPEEAGAAEAEPHAIAAEGVDQGETELHAQAQGVRLAPSGSRSLPHPPGSLAYEGDGSDAGQIDGAHPD